MVGPQSSSPFGVAAGEGQGCVTYPSGAREHRRGLARERFEKSPPM
jgi:hypothetical protein